MTQESIEARHAYRFEERKRSDGSITVEGGRKLNGSLRLQGAKNLALQALTIAVLADGEVVLENFPRIADTEVNLEILEQMGAKVSINDNVVGIDASNINPIDIDPSIAVKTTGSRYFIPVLVRRFGRVATGPSGGDRIGRGDRHELDETVLRAYRQMGIESQVLSGRNGIKRYEFLEASQCPDSIKLDKRFFGPTVQGILSHAVDRRGGEFTICNPSVEPEIFETIKLLNRMGADITYKAEGYREGRDYIRIRGKESLLGARFKIMSDPNALVSYAVAALITDGQVSIEGIDWNDKVQAFLDILCRIGASYYFDYKEGRLSLSPSRSELKPIDLVTDFWLARCHTDWQQLLTPLFAILHGESFIEENVYSARFKNVPALRLMGADINKGVDVLANRIHIKGCPSLYGANVKAPKDIGGTTSLLIAALAAKGKSTIRGADQIARGLENYQDVLNSLGAKITPL